MAFVLCFSLSAVAQYWAPANLPVAVEQLSQFYSDEVEDVFCVVGRTFICEDGPGSQFCAGILRYQGGQWDTLGVFSAGVGSVAHFEDTLFIAGTLGVDGLELPGNTVTWYDGTWHIDPQLYAWDHGIRLRKRDSIIYALGTFEAVPGTDHTGVGFRQGGHWVPLGNLPESSSSSVPQIFDIIEYGGQLVITGNINTTIGDDVFVLQGDDWVPLGGGLVGWNSFGKCLAVYQGDLYLGGGMSMAAGDVGQNIMRWDGNQWHPVGSGLQTQLNNFGNFGTVENMLVHEGELFVGGGFRYAGGIPAHGVARWDGSQWCSVAPYGPTNTVNCFGFFQDTLLINFNGSINGDLMGRIAKFIAPTYEDNCGLWAGIEEGQSTEMPLHVWPNPTRAELRFTTPANGPVHVRILDSSGRQVLERSFTPLNHSIELDIGLLDSGIYQILLNEPLGTSRTTRFVKE